MVEKKLIMKKFIYLLVTVFILFSSMILAEDNLDQWKDSQKTYKDLINNGFEIKSYDTNTIRVDGGLIILFFVTVLQKNDQVFECQEYQTLDNKMNTLDMTLVCRELVQPYRKGIDT